MKNYDVIIIGGGAAGLSAAIYTTRAGMSTMIIERLAVGGQTILTADICNYPGIKKINGAELAMRMHAHAEECGAFTLYDEIEGIDFKTKQIKTAGGVYQAKAIIIATGVVPRKLGVPNEDELVGKGLAYCGLCDGAFYKGKRIVVIGGGNSAVGEAIFMGNIAKSVTLINSTADFNAQKVLTDKLAELKNLENILHNTRVASINTEKGKIVSITTDTGKVIDTDAVFVSIGRIANNGMFAGQITLNPAGYIIVNEKMQTNIPGIFAAGDVTEKIVRQVITAASDGAIAGTFAAEYVNNL